MKRVCLFMVLLCSPMLWPAAANATQEYILPALFDVTGVRADDVLNIRAAPSASAPIIGALAPNSHDIEVVAHDASGRWAQVNTDGESGWVALRYLAYQVGVWDDGRLPPTLQCRGTEPFWSLAPEGGRLVLATPEGDESYALDSVLSTGVFRDPTRALVGSLGADRIVAAITPAQCSDGMSSRAYGLRATVVLDGQHSDRMLSGCCSIAR